MLRIDERKGFPAPFPVVSRGELEKSAVSPRLEPTPIVSLLSRDSFVAETATRIDQLQATMRLIARDVGELAGKVATLQDTAALDHRWHAYQQSEKRTKETKLDEVLRGCRDLKARLDRMEARSSGNYHAYSSFEAVSRKLAELEQFKDAAQRVERSLTARAWLFCGALALACSIIVASHVLST